MTVHGKHRFGRLYTGLAVSALLVGLVYAYVVLSPEGDRLKPQGKRPWYLVGPPVPQEEIRDEASVPKILPDSRISASTRLTYITEYDCGHTETTTKAAPPEFYGLNLKEVEEECKGWKVTGFTPSGVTMERRASGMAPKCRDSMHISVRGNFIAVYHGTPERRCRLKSVTRIPIEGIPQRELEDLKKGIAVKDEDELLKVLEGFASLLGS